MSTDVGVSHMGCLKGCLDYLEMDVSTSWLFGITGHAFINNIGRGVCPSGPTAWRCDRLFALGRNAGFDVETIFGVKSDADFAEKQAKAWVRVREAIDEGYPCYGWELDKPERSWKKGQMHFPSHIGFEVFTYWHLSA